MEQNHSQQFLDSPGSVSPTGAPRGREMKARYLLGLHSNALELVFQGDYTCLLGLNIHVSTRCLAEIRLIYQSEDLYIFK